MQRIQAARDTLTPAERRVADRILANPGEAIALSIGEFAELCGVAQPTVSRFARSLGFHGYPALRLEIAHDFANDRADRETAPAVDQAAGDPLAVVRARLGQDAALASAAQAIRTAPAVEIWASPEMGFAAELMVTGLRELSVPAASSAVATHWHRRAAGLPPGAVVVFLSYDGEAVLARHLDVAKAAGAQVVSVTHAPIRSLAREFDWLVGIPETTGVEQSALIMAEAVTAAVREASLLAGPAGPASPWRTWAHREDLTIVPADGDPVPAVVLSHADRDPARGVCVFFNGMRTTMEDAAPSGVIDGDRIAPSIVAALLNAGRHVVLVDNPAHGARKRVWEDTGDLLTADLESDTSTLIGQSRVLAPAVVDAVLGLGLATGPERLAFVGQSWGGLQVLLSMAGDARIACGVGIMPICAATDLEPFEAYADSAAARLGRITPEDAELLAPRPLLLIGGAEDTIALDARVSDFVDTVRPAYETAGKPELLNHVTLAGVGHAFDARQVDETVQWLSSHLPR
ncbi:hypothetical protein [Kribbella sp. NPDC004536]|uniref:hypothetical protein n=1 Tax=Kribbella sp. NPDC004536 TaxID=3364106 RepID=UPI00368DC380